MIYRADLGKTKCSWRATVDSDHNSDCKIGQKGQDFKKGRKKIFISTAPAEGLPIFLNLKSHLKTCHFSFSLCTPGYL